MRTCLWPLFAIAFLAVPGAGQETATPAQPPKPALRIISYNVLVGFADYRVGEPYHPGEQRRANIRDWLAAEEPDVVALQEMNGYTAAKLRAEATAWGHPHAVMLKETGYPTALTAKQPIEVVERKIEGMHHGLLHCRTGGVDFIVVHLWPFTAEEPRLREARAALTMYANARAEGRPVVLLGDFNAVSPVDVPRMGDAARERLRRWKWETVDGRPRTDVIEAVLAAGAIDLFDRHRRTDAELPLPRIDFVFASADLAARSIASRWLAETARLRNSDHPAVVVDFRAAAPDPPEAAPARQPRRKG